MQDDLQLRLRTDPRLLCAARSLVRNYVALFGFDEERTGEIVLAVDEACANALRHSYQGRTDQELLLSLRASEDGLEIALCDQGIPISREMLHPPDAARIEAERLIPGGLGLHLIHGAFDEVVYEPGEISGNSVRMRVKRAPGIGSEACP